jgi:hypothetical protein
MLVTTNILLSNALFLLIRAFVKHKVHPEFKIEKKRQLQQIDTLKALAPLADQFVNMTVPVLTSLILYVDNLFDLGHGLDVSMLFECLMVTGLFSFIDMMLQMFVSWKKGPKMWVKMAPYIYFINIHTTYLLWPALNLSLVVYFFVVHKDAFFKSPYSAWALTISIF